MCVHYDACECQQNLATTTTNYHARTTITMIILTNKKKTQNKIGKRLKINKVQIQR